MSGGGKPVHEPGTGSDQIESPCASCANRVLYQTRRGREQHVGRHSADDNGVDLGSLHTALSQSTAGRFGSHIGSRHFWLGNVALPDSGAIHNPIVIRIDELL